MSPPDWKPEKYLEFQELRAQPIRDLIARTVARKPQFIVDLGCGPGNSTALLKAAFPLAKIKAVDSSSAMIKKAAETLSGIHFERADATQWNPPPDVDLVFSNAMFQWLPSHDEHLARILRALRKGAALAIQMPDNLDEPSHQVMAELAKTPAWNSTLGNAAAQRCPLRPVAHYHDLLLPLSSKLTIWRTTYVHHFQSHTDIADLLSTTGLKPYLDPLSDGERTDFLDAYCKALRARYPVLADGSLLYAFPRLFIVAIRGDT
jgi:trans-aconitate 2-methyltransferase